MQKTQNRQAAGESAARVVLSQFVPHVQRGTIFPIFHSRKGDQPCSSAAFASLALLSGLLFVLIGNEVNNHGWQG